MRRVFFLTVLGLAIPHLPAAAQDIPLEACEISGVQGGAQCAVYNVYENRRTREGRRIGLNVVLLPATGPNVRPDPLMLLVGGPGQSATRSAAIFNALLAPLRRDRDLVLLDQRGTGGSSALQCRWGDTPPAVAAVVLSFNFSPAAVARCRENLEADPALYTTDLAVDDLDDVRAALGYEQVNLLGFSYGTRVALEYLRRFSTRTRSAILVSAMPPEMIFPLSMPRSLQHSLGILASECQAQAICQGMDGGLVAEVGRLMARLDAEPVTLQIPVPGTSDSVPFTIDRGVAAGTIGFALFRPETWPGIPTSVARAVAGDYAPLTAQALALGGFLAQDLYWGMFLAVVCADDVPLINDAAITRETAGTFFGGDFLHSLRNACASWPTGTATSDLRTPVAVNVPVLLISGEWDPATPPKGAQRIAATLSNTKHIVMPRAGHTPINACSVGIIAAFLADRSTGGALDVSCA
ncbi:MAG: alpha/beta hydrolase, partial [Candidatus Krumholzibacteria bacterium]